MLSALTTRWRNFFVYLIPGCCLFALLLTPGSVLAHPALAAAQAPTLTATFTADTVYREKSWTVVQVQITDIGQNFASAGTLVAQVCTFAGGRNSETVAMLSPWSYKLPVRLHAGTTLQTTIPVPNEFGNFVAQGAQITLLDAHGKKIAQTTTQNGYKVEPVDILIGALSDRSDDLSLAMISVALPNQKNSPTTTKFDASSFPTQVSLLSTYNALILSDFSTRSLSPAQLTTLRAWVNQGGVLIEVGGAQWRRTLAPLPPDLLPVSLTGIQTLPTDTPLYPFQSPSSMLSLYNRLPNSAPGPVTTSTSILRPSSAFSSNEVLLAADSTPLLVKAQQGQGAICYLAFDPMEPPLLKWANQPYLWQTIFLSTLGEKFLIPETSTVHTSGPGDLLLHAGVIRMLAPEALLGPWLLIVLLIIYVLVLGPIRILLLRRLQPVDLWRWRIIIASTVLFSALMYGVAGIQRNQEYVDNTVSVLQLNQDGAFAHVTTYHGVFVPTNKPFTLHLEGTNLAQPPSNNLLNYAQLTTASAELPFSVTYAPKETQVQFANTGAWKLHTLVTERDTPLPGRISAQLSLKGSRLVGKISNTLGSTVNDLSVLIPHGFVTIGSVGAGETRMVDLPITLTPGTTLLADEIARQENLKTPYFPYTQSKTPANDFERHMALLSALSGAGTSFKPCAQGCGQHAIPAQGSLYFSDEHLPTRGKADVPDPLLLSRASATLIGWLDQTALPGSGVRIDTFQPQGQHENFFQLPVALGLSTLDPASTNAISGQVIDIQPGDSHLLLPGIYTLSNGGITFELRPPQPLPQRPGVLRISLPDLLASPKGLKLPANLNRLQAFLYNWQTKQWDAIQLQQNTFSSRNIAAYLGDSQRLLLHINNDTNNLGTLIFGIPSLTLQR